MPAAISRTGLFPKVWLAAWAAVLCSAGGAFAAPQLHWEWKLPARKPAWEHTQRMPLDTGYVPAAGGGLVFVGCEHNGALLALDAQSGAEKWRFYTGGPIRFAPVADAQRVYVGSDDGFVYALDHSGRELWRAASGKPSRFVLGHERMISAWPISARPALHEGRLFFVAGYWPVDGVVLQAVAAETGQPVWRNTAVEFRPGREVSVSEGKVWVEGSIAGGVFDAATGAALAEKYVSPARPAAPETNGIKGNLTGFAPLAAGFVAGSTHGVFGFGEGAPAGGVVSHELDAGAGAVAESASAGNAAGAPEGELAEILRQAEVRAGYCLVAGLETGKLVASLVRETQLHVVAIDNRPDRVAAARQALDRQGLFATHRLSVLQGNVESLGLPPYFASLIVAENGQPPAAATRCVRPYGGARVARTAAGEYQVERRAGPPEGGRDWPQEFHSAANTLASSDTGVKAPLGLLWYGGLAAHGKYYFDGFFDHQSGHGLNPQPVPAQFVAGRMILQSAGLLAAFDMYTGRLLWELPLPSVYSFGGPGGGLGIHSKNHPQPWKHEPAAKFDVIPTHRCRPSGFNMVSLPDGIFLAVDRHLLRVDPATGKEVSRFEVPAALKQGEPELCWGGLRVEGDFLIATFFRPADLADAQAGNDGNGGDWAGDRMPMSHLAVLDRKTGSLVWHRRATWGFTNRSGVAAGGGKVYCVDLAQQGIIDKYKEAGRKLPQKGDRVAPPMLYALDLATGGEVWNFPLTVLVNNLAYAEHRDLLLVPNRNLRTWQEDHWVEGADPDKPAFLDKNKGKNATGLMRALRGRDGSVAWEVSESAYHTPLVVVGDLLIDRYGFAFDLATGRRHLRTSLVTGSEEPWSFKKAGCNHLIACNSLVTWRTACYDLQTGAGVVPLLGMEAGCSPTLVPAGGVLNVPNFGTHHKRHRMTAMALVHVPENDMWTNYSSTQEKQAAAQPLRRVGFNFGAPGDRLASQSALWLQVSAREKAGLTWEGANVQWYGDGLVAAEHWVAATGATGIASLVVPTTSAEKPTKAPAALYTVRLHFSEPLAQAAGQRVFSVSLQGKPVLTAFDISKEAGGPHRAVVREFTGVVCEGSLRLDFSAQAGEPLLAGLELVREE